MVECYDWVDLLVGLDFIGYDDMVVMILMDIVWLDMVLCSIVLVDEIVQGLCDIGVWLNNNLCCSVMLVVLNVFDFFLVLIEVGFLLN